MKVIAEYDENADQRYSKENFRGIKSSNNLNHKIASKCKKSLKHEAKPTHHKNRTRRHNKSKLSSTKLVNSEQLMASFAPHDMSSIGSASSSLNSYDSLLTSDRTESLDLTESFAEPLDRVYSALDQSVIGFAPNFITANESECRLFGSLLTSDRTESLESSQPSEKVFNFDPAALSFVPSDISSIGSASSSLNSCDSLLTSDRTESLGPIESFAQTSFNGHLQLHADSHSQPHADSSRDGILSESYFINYKTTFNTPYLGGVVEFHSKRRARKFSISEYLPNLCSCCLCRLAKEKGEEHGFCIKNHPFGESCQADMPRPKATQLKYYAQKICEVCMSSMTLLSEKTKSKKHKCIFDSCAVEIKTKTALQNHFAKHLKTKLFVCTICEKDYCSKSGLKNHERKHR